MSVERREAYRILNLTPFFNNDGISSDADRRDGNFNGAGATYPEEDLPVSRSLLECEGVVFRFPDKGNGLDNNIALEGQRIPVPQDVYDCLYLLGASDGANLEDAVRFIFADGGQEEAFLGLSGWGKRHSLRYGERVAVQCSGYHFPSRHVYTDRVGVDYGIWMQRTPIRAVRPTVAIALPDNPGMHIFAMTLHRACQEER
jgi:hypothetical protein